MEISDRLRQVIDYLGISVSAFATQIGISQPRVRNYLLGREPDSDTLGRIAKTFVIINVRWLLIGEGEMLMTGRGGNESATGQFEEIKNLTQAISDVSRSLVIANQTILLQQEFIASSCKSENPPPILSPKRGRLDVKCQANEGEDETV